MLKKYITLFLCLVAVNSCNKEERIIIRQTGTLKINMYGWNWNPPSPDIANCSIHLYNDSFSFKTITNSAGFAEIKNIPIGYYYLKAEQDSNYTYSLKRIYVNGVNSQTLAVCQRTKNWLELIKYDKDTFWFIGKQVPAQIKWAFSPLVIAYFSKTDSMPDEDHCESVSSFYFNQKNKSDTIYIVLTGYLFYVKNLNRPVSYFSLEGAFARFGLHESTAFAAVHYDSINRIAYRTYATGKLTPPIIMK